MYFLVVHTRENGVCMYMDVCVSECYTNMRARGFSRESDKKKFFFFPREESLYFRFYRNRSMSNCVANRKESQTSKSVRISF